jgi:hypothetical protein
LEFSLLNSKNIWKKLNNTTFIAEDPRVNNNEMRTLGVAPSFQIKIEKKKMVKKTKVRYIYVPDLRSKVFYRSLLPYLYKIHDSISDKRYAYGFLPTLNCCDHAQQHIGYKYTIKLDIKDFFESIKRDLVTDLIAERVSDYLFVDGSARQGIPTSPIVSNIAFAKIDKEINNALNSISCDKRNYRSILSVFAYSRYADDISISFNNHDTADLIFKTVIEILSLYKFEINSKKTKLLDSKNGRRIISGVSVGYNNIYPTRKTLKKIRAATHQRNINSLIGLCSWKWYVESKSGCTQ